MKRKKIIGKFILDAFFKFIFLRRLSDIEMFELV